MAKLAYVVGVHSPSLGELPVKEGSASFKPSGFERSYVAAERPVDGGYTEAHQPASLELTLNPQSVIDVQSLNTLTNENLTILLSTNEQYFMPNA